VIRLSDDSGINEKFISLTTGEKYRNTQGIRIYGYFIYITQYAPLIKVQRFVLLVIFSYLLEE